MRLGVLHFGGVVVATMLPQLSNIADLVGADVG